MRCSSEPFSRGYRVRVAGRPVAPSRLAWLCCFAFDLPLASYDAIDHNLCHAAAGANQWVRGRGDLAAWQRYSGTSGTSTARDPRYGNVSAGTYLLSPASLQSPLVNAGDPVLSAPLAIGEVARDAVPDIGAYESGP
jgi:hypothetical protein